MSGLSRDDIDEIIRLVEHSSFDELKLEVGDTRIEIRRRGAGGSPGTVPARPEPPGPAVTAGAVRPAATTPTPPTPPTTAATAAQERADGTDVPAPQLGIFWHAPRPGEAPFVSVGDTVEDDTVIGIIEVMKLMNTVAAGITGTVTEVVAPNGQPVKQGDTLIRVRPD